MKNKVFSDGKQNINSLVLKHFKYGSKGYWDFMNMFKNVYGDGLEDGWKECENNLEREKDATKKG